MAKKAAKPEPVESTEETGDEPGNGTRPDAG